MDLPYDTSTYELTLEPLRGQLASRQLTEEPQLAQYGNLYIKPPEKLSYFENYIKNRIASSTFMNETANDQKRPNPFIRKRHFTPYMANIDLSKSKFDHETSEHHPNTSYNDVTNGDLEEVPTPRGIISSFLKNDPSERINARRQASTEKTAVKKVDPHKFFFARAPSSKPETMSPDSKIVDSVRTEVKEEQRGSVREKKSKKKESIMSNSYLDASNNRANDTTQLPPRHSSVISKKERGSLLTPSSCVDISHDEGSLSNLNMSKELEKSMVDSHSFLMPGENEETRKLRELENRVKQHLNSEYKPIYKDSYDEKMFTANTGVQRDIFEGLKRKMKAFTPKVRTRSIPGKGPDMLKRKESLGSVGSGVDSKRADSVDKLSDIIIDKNEKNIDEEFEKFPKWLKDRREFKEEYMKNIRKVKNLVIYICEKHFLERTIEELHVVATWLSRVRVFKDVPETTLVGIAGKLTHKLYDKDEILCYQGEIGDCLYIIYDGSVKCIVNGNHVASYKALDAPGQLALEGPAKRTATLKAETVTSVLRLQKEDFREIMEPYISLEKTHYFALLKETKVFKDFGEKKLKLISSVLQSKYFSKGECVYQEGEAAESMYVVRYGLVQIESTITMEKENSWPEELHKWIKTKTTRDMKFTHKLYPKEYFGEIELIKSIKRQHSVRCLTNCQLLILNRNDFTSILDIEELSRLKNALYDNVLEDPEVMKQKLFENEAERRTMRDLVSRALGDYMKNFTGHELHRLNDKVMLPTLKNVKKRFSKFLRHYTVRSHTTHDDVNNRVEH